MEGDQARPDPSVNAQVAKPKATVTSAPPNQSRLPAVSLTSLSTQRDASTIAATDTGTLIRKARRQLPASISHPPKTGPTAPAAAPVAAHMPIARPFASPEKLRPRIARLFGISMAALAPCTKRASSNKIRVGATAQAREAMPNSKTPVIKRRRRPYRSPAAPPSKRSALKGSK